MPSFYCFFCMIRCHHVTKLLISIGSISKQCQKHVIHNKSYLKWNLFETLCSRIAFLTCLMVKLCIIIDINSSPGVLPLNTRLTHQQHLYLQALFKLVIKPAIKIMFTSPRLKIPISVPLYLIVCGKEHPHTGCLRVLALVG